MKITIDTEAKAITVANDSSSRVVDLYSTEGFEILSEQWLKVGWNEKYPYTFTWLGRPIIQIPEDIVRMQEMIYSVKPTLIIETGVAHGGSLILYSSLLRAIGRGRVIGVDIEIRPHNRSAIEAHELSDNITLIEGSSIAESTLAQIAHMIRPTDRTMVVLDSNHTKAHVLAELEKYSPFVSPGSYIVATDGSMGILHDVPRAGKGWREDNPAAAARDFAGTHSDFEICDPIRPFNESKLNKEITHWPSAWLRRRG